MGIQHQPLGQVIYNVWLTDEIFLFQGVEKKVLHFKRTRVMLRQRGKYSNFASLILRSVTFCIWPTMTILFGEHPYYCFDHFAMNHMVICGAIAGLEQGTLAFRKTWVLNYWALKNAVIVHTSRSFKVFGSCGRKVANYSTGDLSYGKTDSMLYNSTKNSVHSILDWLIMFTISCSYFIICLWILT